MILSLVLKLQGKLLKKKKAGGFKTFHNTGYTLQKDIHLMSSFGSRLLSLSGDNLILNSLQIAKWSTII